MKKTETAYIIRELKTGQLVEAHDDLSLEWATRKVEIHNKLYPHDKWVLSTEEL